MITFKETHVVYLDKKIIGTIEQVDGGYQYVTKCKKHRGEVFQSVAAVKRDVIGD